MIKHILVYNTDCTDPYINIATEKYLFDNLQKDCCIMYLWQNKNTVVIGKNQNPWTECDVSSLERDGVLLARRISGGGAVFHDLGNLNFTFICNADDYDLTRQLSVISLACKGAGIDTEISGRNDILVQGKKFSGNAFYNSAGKAFHHGTILISANTEVMQKYLTPSKAKLKSNGVKSVKSRVVNLSELSPTLNCHMMKNHMISAFEKVFQKKAEIHECVLNESIGALAKEFSKKEYLYGLAIPFTFCCEGRFDWGGIRLELVVKNGVIKDVQVFTDALDHSLADSIRQSLLNCKFEKNAVKCAVSDDVYSIMSAILP